MNHFNQIAERLSQCGLDGMLLTGAANRFYATGFRSSAGVALVTPKGGFFLTDSRYIEAAQKNIQNFTVEELQRGDSYVSAIAGLVEKLEIHALGCEEQEMTISEYRRYQTALGCTLQDGQSLLSELRAAKTEEEVAAIRKAQQITDQAFEEILTVIKPGMTELEVAAELSYRMRRKGAEKDSFDPIVASGPNSSMPHSVPTQRKLQPGDFVTMDFGCIYDGYCSDMTRTVAIGFASEEMKHVYNVVLQAQLEGIKAARAGVVGKSVDAAARAYIESAGYGQNFGHGFGHSLGIEIHEGPNLNTAEERLLPVGTVVSAEPGIYLPGKFGVRIEDILLLQKTGNENLTHSPKELLIL